MSRLIDGELAQIVDEHRRLQAENRKLKEELEFYRRAYIDLQGQEGQSETKIWPGLYR